MKLYLSERDFQQLYWGGAKRCFVSYYFYQDLQLERLLYKNFLNGLPEIFADSGAFQGYSMGKELSVDKYAQWLYQWKHLFIGYANLDSIDSEAKTMENQEYLESCGLKPLPVFHVTSDFKQLEYLLENYDYIGLGGMVPYMKEIKKIMPWLIKCWKLKNKINSRAKFHGFGCTNWEILSKLPWYSVDSSTWTVANRFGEVPIFDVLKSRFIRCKLGEWRQWQKHASVLRSLGYDWRDFAGRKIHRSDVCKVAASSFHAAENYLTEKWGIT